MDKRTTVLVIDDTKSMHQFWHEQKQLFQLYIDNLNFRRADSLSEGKQLFENLGIEIDAIAIDACVPGNSINSDHFVRWLRSNLYSGKGKYGQVVHAPRFDGPIIGISDIPLYQQIMKQAGCSHVCGKFQLIEAIVKILEVKDKEQAKQALSAKKSPAKKTRQR